MSSQISSGIVFIVISWFDRWKDRFSHHRQKEEIIAVIREEDPTHNPDSCSCMLLKTITTRMVEAIIQTCSSSLDILCIRILNDAQEGFQFAGDCLFA